MRSSQKDLVKLNTIYLQLHWLVAELDVPGLDGSHRFVLLYTTPFVFVYRLGFKKWFAVSTALKYKKRQRIIPPKFSHIFTKTSHYF